MSAGVWQPVGAGPATELVEARLQLHHAAQVVAAVGCTYLEPRPDDSHPNLGWVDALGALVGHPTPGPRSFQAGLRLGELALILLDATGGIADELPLDGATVDDAYAWLEGGIGRCGVPVPGTGLTRPTYEIPDHALAHGAAFSRANGASLKEVARWFANGHHSMVDLAARVEGASDVRCWPHHFDVGALAALATHADGSLAKSIGMGFSPGDGSYPEPYWYVSPWPYPKASDLAGLSAGGQWHTAGFTSAVLTRTQLLSGGPEAEQPTRLHAFLDGAVAASRRALQ